jgi:hypothetical protein
MGGFPDLQQLARHRGEKARLGNSAQPHNRDGITIGGFGEENNI